MKRYLLLLALVGCKWTDFDDLSKSTWVHSTQSPNIGSTDYAVALAGTTLDPTGGRLSVISNDTPTYSTLIYDAKGNPTLGPNPERLADHNIASLGEQPIFVVDNAGHFAVVAASTSPNFIAVTSGDAAAPGDTSIQSGLPPDAAAFVGGELVIAAGNNLFVVGANGTKWCTDTMLGAIALGADATELYAWQTSGKLIEYSKTALDGCVMMTSSTTAGTTVAPDAGTFDAGFVPGVGAVVQVLPATGSTKELLVLAAHPDKATNGQVIVIDQMTMTKTDSVPADGIESAVVGTLGAAGKPYVAIGFPTRAVGSTITGQVELHGLDATTGKLSATDIETLYDDQPDSNEEFGRAVGIMQFNGSQILAVAAKNEVFTYFETLSYPETRQ